MRIKKRNIVSVLVWGSFVITILLVACSKVGPAPTPDPGTGGGGSGGGSSNDTTPKPLTSATGECRITKITQRNSSDVGNADYIFQIQRDAALSPTSFSSYDSLLKRNEYTITVQTVGDTIKLSTGEYLVTSGTTKLVTSLYTWSDLTDKNSDKQLYKYEYNANGYLSKKYCYVNGSSSSYYETQYTYDNNNLLTGCTLYAGSKRDKLLQSVLDYDMTTARKPWIYLFTDFFEGYHYLQAFNFGKRGTYPVKNITTNIYDVNSGATLDTWATVFSNYTYSTDGFILQTSAKGDQQQGLGLVFGTTKFTYLCTQ